MHELDYFWVEKNPDKRFTKYPFVVIARDSLYEQGTINQTGLTFKQATHEASWRNAYATSESRLWRSSPNHEYLKRKKELEIEGGDKWRKKVRADLLHQIWYSVTNQEEKEIEENKNHELSQEEIDSRIKSYTKWKIKYLREFLKDR